MKHKEALETFTSDNFLNGYSDDIQEINKDTIKYIIDSIYEDFNNQICLNCSKLIKDTIDLYEASLPIWAIGRCTVPGHLYRKAVSPTFGCNLWEKEQCNTQK